MFSKPSEYTIKKEKRSEFEFESRENNEKYTTVQKDGYWK